MNSLIFLYSSSAVFTCAGFVLCIRNLRKSNSLTVSFSSWLIWLTAEILNFFTCLAETRSDQSYNLLFAIITVIGTFAIVVTACRKRLFGKIVPLDVIIIMLLLISAFTWLHEKNDYNANTIVLIAICIGYLATAWGIVLGTLKDKPNSWFLISIGSILTLIAYSIETQVSITNIHFAIVSAVGEGVVCVIIVLRNLIKNRLK